MMPISLYKEGVSLEPKPREQNNIKDDVDDLERKVTILFTDNNQDILVMLSKKLVEKGYDVLSYKDKIAALIVLKKIKEQNQEFPLIISNVMSPVTGGFEFFKRAREIAPNVKFVFLSASQGKEYVDRAKQMGANAYFKKPIDLPILYQSIERVLQGGDFFEVI